MRGTTDSSRAAEQAEADRAAAPPIDQCPSKSDDQTHQHAVRLEASGDDRRQIERPAANNQDDLDSEARHGIGRASRRSLLLLSVAPVWLSPAVLCLRLWPWQQAAGHVALPGLLGMLLADICLHGFGKIPFTCSCLPGKSQVHMVFLGAIGLMWGVVLGVKFERQAL